MPGRFPRIWAEPETKGEAYIPLAMDRRPRAEGILSEVANRFGGTFLKPSPESILEVENGRVSATMRMPSTLANQPVSAAAAGQGELLAAIDALTARVGDVESAVYAGASHVGDRDDSAVQTQARTVGLASQQQPQRT